MYSLADYYRHRGLVAQQEAAQTLNEVIRNTFQEVARGWFELADLDRREADQQSDEKR
jgi:outer membrane protein TolC